MGYYSFYRIIRDIIKTIFGKKMWKYTLIILIVFSICLIFCKNGVFAESQNINILPSNENFVLTVDFSNQITSLNNNNIASNVWDYDNLAFLNYTDGSNYFLTIICWNGDLTIDSTYPANIGAISTGDLYYYRAYYYWGGSNLGRFSTAFSQYTHVNANSTTYGLIDNNISFIYSSSTIYDNNGDTVIEGSENQIKNPEIATSLQDLETLNFDVISVNAWDYSEQDLYLLCYDRNFQEVDSLKNLYPVREILLNQNSTY